MKLTWLPDPRHALFFVIALALFAPSLSATPINLMPNDSFFVPDGTGPIGGTIEPGTGVSLPFVSGTFNGSLTTTVYSGDTTNPYGGLTFTYLLVNNAAPPPAGDIDRITINDYAGFTVDGSYQAPTAGVLPTLVDRDSSGDVMGFSFLTLPGNLGHGPLHKGFTSALLVLQTNAQFFQPTLAAIIDGGTANVPSFGPAVPEPSSIALAVLGVVSLAACRRKFSRRQQKSL